MTLVEQPDLIARRARASEWFLALQKRIMEAFETVEAEANGPFFPEAEGPGKAEFKPWSRTNHDGSPGGGGTMGMLRGRVFEKAGVHVSHVMGRSRLNLPRKSLARIWIRTSPPPAFR